MSEKQTKSEKEVEQAESHRTDTQHSAFHRDGSGLGIERAQEPTDYERHGSSGPGTGGSPNVPVANLPQGAEMDEKDGEGEKKK